MPVARLLPEVDVVEDRRAHLLVAPAHVLDAPELGQLVPDVCAARQPEGRARRQLAEHEQVELAAELAVVARPRLLQAPEVLLQLLLREKRGAIHAREHLVVGVAAPVGAGDARELERVDPLGAGPVRTAAEVGERPVPVERHRVDPAVPDEVFDQLDLVVLPLRFEALDRLLGRHVRTLEALVRLDVLAHLLLDASEVVLRQLHVLGELEVVVEAVLDRRADRDLHPGVQLHHGGGEHVGGVVAHQPERAHAVLVALRRDDLDPVAVAERRGEIAELAVHADAEGCPREPLADRARGVGAGCAVLQLEAGAVGELDRH